MRASLADLKQVLFNPLTRRLSQRASCMTSPAIFWAVLLGTAFISGVQLIWPTSRYSILLLALIATISTTISLPMFVSNFASHLAAGYAHSPEHELISVTVLSDADIVWGYLVAAFQRCGVHLALALGLTPLLPVVMTLFNLSTSGPLWESTGAVMAYGYLAVVLGVGLIGITFLASALGISLSLWWRGASPAAGVSFMLVALATVWAITRLSGTAFSYRLIQFPDGVWLTLTALTPYLLGLGLMRFAQVWSRQINQSYSTAR